MGFVLSILYFLTYYLTPEVLFGALAAYRVELILASLLFLISVPFLAGSTIFKTVQSLALIGLAFATFTSILISERWTGGGVAAFLLFIPNAFAYYLVCLHCTSKLKLQILILTMLFVCLFVIGQGVTEMRQGLPTTHQGQNADEETPYFFAMDNDAGQLFYRLRGKGEINDPNDFAQLIVCLIPLVFIFWRPKRLIRNFFFVLVPVGLLVCGAYLTHSRGSILALLAVVVMAIRRKIGTIPALILAGALFAAAMALHFTGGRDISTTAGEDRTALWGEGLELLKAHPLFGVGYNQMPEYATQTAHNTIVVCAAELGLFGLYFWSLFLLPSVRDAFTLASPKKVTEGGVADVVIAPHESPPSKTDELDKAEINRLGRLMVLSLTGFLVAGWFLSRAYVVTLFLLGGMTEVIYGMALSRGMIEPRLPFGRVLRYAGIMMVGLVLLMYIVLRIVNLTH